MSGEKRFIQNYYIFDYAAMNVLSKTNIYRAIINTNLLIGSTKAIKFSILLLKYILFIYTKDFIDEILKDLKINFKYKSFLKKVMD